MQSRVPFLLSVTIWFLGGCSSKEGSKPPTAADNLQGTWTIVSSESDGRQNSESDLGRGGWKIGTSTISTFKEGESGEELNYKLDPKQNPKSIDISKNNEKEKGYGIYVLEGDKLKVCVSGPSDKERPSKFEGGSGRALWIFQRGEPTVVLRTLTRTITVDAIQHIVTEAANSVAAEVALKKELAGRSLIVTKCRIDMIGRPQEGIFALMHSDEKENFMIRFLGSQEEEKAILSIKEGEMKDVKCHYLSYETVPANSSLSKFLPPPRLVTFQFEGIAE